MSTRNVILLSASLLLSGLPVALAQGTAFTYQGRLTDGANPANGLYDLQFGAYDAAVNGNLVGGLVTNQAVAVSNGVFVTTIDFGGGVFTGNAMWLDIAVSTNGANSFTSLSPRQALSPVPYAIYSPTSGTAGTASALASGAVSASQLNTTGTPGAGQVLAFNGTQLVWQNAVVGTNAGGWSLTGNRGTAPGLNFLGTADNEPFEIRSGGVRAMRLEPDLTGAGAPNVIGGSPANAVANGVVGATITGGGATNLSGAGAANRVTASYGAIGGGVKNIAGGPHAFVGGGYQNTASGYISAIAGGAYNFGTNDEASVLGGAYNLAGGMLSTVGGGYENAAIGDGSFVGGGGYDPWADPTAPSIGNTASGAAAAVEGGIGNVAQGDYSTAGGGYLNAVSGECAVVPGGAFNSAAGTYSFAAGYHATATYAGCFVWADSSSGFPFSSSAGNQFLVRAVGGVGIGTSQTPPGGLRVDSGGLAVTGASSPNYGTAQGVFLERFGSTAGVIYGYNYSKMQPLSLALNSPGGNVGIGTLNPQKTLEVNGTAQAHSLALIGGADVAGAALEVSGMTSTRALTITGGADVAEPFKVGGGELPKGSVVVIDEDHPGELRLSSRSYDTRVAGIVSGANGVNPGISLRQEGVNDGGQNVALSGRVYVLADASNGTIKPGDLLTTSETPGHAMKVGDHTRAQGAILGKAMSGLKEGRGLVLVLVTLQ